MKSNSKLLGIVMSLIFAGGTVFAFFWVWTQMNKSTAAPAATAYTPIEVKSVKKEAEDILANKEKYNSDIPLKADSSKAGRDNPFAK